MPGTADFSPRGASAPPFRRRVIPVALLALAASAFAQVYQSNLPADHPAIRYAHPTTEDPAAKLNRKLERGETTLEYRDASGYLPSLLQQFGINIDSQALVFSKTSFQAAKISPRNPRAIYFDDDVAVGWVRGGSGMEIASLDPRQGIVFYTLDAQKQDHPRLVRQQVCLRCHQGPATEGVPGIFVGSVFPNASGDPYQQDAIITDHRTAFADRWGGWYVNAAHGEQRDRANSVAPDPAEPETLANDGLQNQASLIHFFNPTGYLAPLSDIVALMTFEHQTQMVNMMTRVGWDQRMGQSAALDADIESLVRYMLFADEAPLAEPLQGVSSFTKTFPQRGPRDRQRRSLRDFDLERRLFRYPLSYMIYSAEFNALPAPALGRIYQRLYQVLAAKNADPKFARLSDDDRRAILQILRDTKPGLPSYFRN